MSELDLRIDEREMDDERGYHFRVLAPNGNGGTVLYASTEHLDELRIPPVGYPNPHLASAVAKVVRKQLSNQN